MKTLTNISEASIYVGTYEKYNNGSIEGKWLKLSDYSNLEDFYTACKELHADEEDPEFMFQDSENIPSDLVGESFLSENIFEIIEAIGNIDNKEAFCLFLDNEGTKNLDDIDRLISNFEESYCGEFSNGLEDYAYELVEDCYFTRETPDIFKTYFDYEKFARDLGYEGYWEADGHVFRPY